MQARAAANTHLAGFSGQFRAVASTAATDARDNTATTGTGVPIYWLGGAKVADDYADFYDGSWDSVAVRNEAGNTISGTPQIWSGSDTDGTENSATTFQYGLGRSQSAVATPTVTALPTGHFYAITAPSSGSRRLYALSPVITVRAGMTSDEETVTTEQEHENLNVMITPGSDRLHLEWNPVKGAESYSVRWGTSPNYTGDITIPRDDPRGTSYTITSLEPDTLYHVQVYANMHIASQNLRAWTKGEGAGTPEPPMERNPGSVERDSDDPAVSRPGGGGAPSPPPPPPPPPPSSPDRAPLLVLYEAAGGGNWENKWDRGFPIDDWHGVRTNEDGRVTELDLSGNGLSGDVEEITEEIGKLSYLETLDLSRNPGLSGELPTDLMKLENLRTLDIQNTGLCAPLDEEFQDWLMGITFRGENCAEETEDEPQVSGGGGCSVASGKETGAGSAFLGLLLVASVLLAVCPGRARMF